CLAHGDEAFAQEVAEKNKDIQIVIYSDGVAKDSYVDNTLLVSTNDYGETLGLIEIGDRNSVQHIAVSETYGENEEIVNQIQSYKKSVSDTILRRYGLSYKENYARADFNMVLPALEDKRSEVGYFIADAFKEAYVLREDDEVKDVIGIVDAEGITAPIMNGNLSINDIFRLSAKGKGEDDLVGTSLIRVYVKGSDLRNLCELDATLLSDEEHQKDKLYFGGMKYKYNDEGVAWNKVEEVYTSVTVDYYTIINDRRYYPVVMSERVYHKLNQYFQNEAKALSFHAYGLDQDPEPEMRTLIMRNNDGTIIKEWVAIAKYFSLFERDGSTYILSRNYENMAPRKEIDHSFNMLRFLRNVRRVAWERYFGYILMAIGGLVALKVIVWGINKMRNKQKAEK
ncbi:MAG: 5'-nucleotidase C-terminal domain-containing protein, partial [Solobacterium sp.]|nr:5'-nucleotidase C-terminal domain-containing protein [Solobacterium sp.]